MIGWRWWSISSPSGGTPHRGLKTRQGLQQGGRLTSVNNVPWDPGEQEAAVCSAWGNGPRAGTARPPIYTPAYQANGLPWVDDDGNELYRQVRDKTHQVPDLDCGCGYWAFYDPEIAVGLPKSGFHSTQCQVFGVIEAWGGIVEHDYGFRAEFCAIRALTIVRGRLHPAYLEDIDLCRNPEEMIARWDSSEHDPYNAPRFKGGS